MNREEIEGLTVVVLFIILGVIVLVTWRSCKFEDELDKSFRRWEEGYEEL